MAANPLPSGIGDLFQLAEIMHDALARFGEWLLKRTVTEAELTRLLTAAREAESQFATARSEKAAAAKRFAAADEALTGWLAKARLVVMLACGSKWSESWIETGFTHRGTNVPKRIAPRMELVQRLAGFLAEHPEVEVAFARITAAEAAALQKRIEEARQDVRLANKEAAEKKRARDTAEKALRWAMRAVIRLLPCVINKNDPRWAEFGLNVPAPEWKPRPSRSVSVPEVIELAPGIGEESPSSAASAA